MSERNDILTQLMTDLNKIKVSRSYKTEVSKIVRGNINNIQTNTKEFPAIYVWFFDDDREEEFFGGDLLRNLSVRISGVLEHIEYPGDRPEVDRIHDFVDDIEDFVRSSDWTHQLKTLVGKVQVLEYDDNNRLECRVEIMIRYVQE